MGQDPYIANLIHEDRQKRLLDPDGWLAEREKAYDDDRKRMAAHVEWLREQRNAMRDMAGEVRDKGYEILRGGRTEDLAAALDELAALCMKVYSEGCRSQFGEWPSRPPRQ